jgi:hypothetical protein
MGAPNGAPVSPPSTVSSTAFMYDESSEARKSTALARSSGSPQRESGTVEEKRSETFADSSAVALARTPRFQMGVFVAPGVRSVPSAKPVSCYRRWIKQKGRRHMPKLAPHPGELWGADDTADPSQPLRITGDASKL